VTRPPQAGVRWKPNVGDAEAVADQYSSPPSAAATAAMAECKRGWRRELRLREHVGEVQAGRCRLKDVPADFRAPASGNQALISL
jgi:hypothetical protein